MLLLLALELVLRLFCYGYPAGFFLQSRANGRDVFIENQEFARRFFPPGLERSPLPMAIPAVKTPGTCRIFVFGESAAMGDPAPDYGFARQMEVLLRAQFPEKQFEVVNVAFTAISSHVIREIARDCAPRDGDVWIIYMGNNEVVGPFGAGTIFGPQAPGLAFIRASLALKTTRTGQLLDALRHHLTRKKTPATWDGMEMFLNQQLRQDDPRLTAVYKHFQRNLEDILQLGAHSGAKLIVSTVPGNLKDCPPFASLHRADLTTAQFAGWNQLFQAATNHEAARNFPAALAAYEQAAQLDDRFAELHFRVGRCQWALGRFAEARKRFELARDLDTLRFRADTRINHIIRQVAGAQRGTGVTLVDAAEICAKQSPHDVTGEEFFWEHVHPNFDGNHLLARTLADQVTAALVLSARSQSPPLPAAECARRLALTDWDRFQIVDEVFKRLQQPPFTHQLDHAGRKARLEKARAELQPAIRAEAFGPAAAIYRAAIALTPDDWRLHENFAKLLQEFGEPARAEQEWKTVVRLLPHHEAAHYSLGNVLEAQGKTAEAVVCFQQSLSRRPDLVEPRNGLGLALANLGKFPDALREYEAALRRKPDFVEARINLGQLLAQQGRMDEALAHYAAALRANSNSVAAHINLGKLLASQGKVTDALAHYETAVRLKPDHALAHHNLGNALSALGRAEASAHFAEAVRLRPDLFEARYNLGLALAKQGRYADALAHFSEVVRLQPTFAGARFNFGVALAKERRFDEAIAQFQETLRLEPENRPAQELLGKAMTLRRQ